MADNVIVRVPEQQFIKGEDGYSPEVTIEDIAHGHSVTITDRDHPTGQSFNVMDGDSAYEQAVAGGYTGTEAQFNEELASFKELSEQAADSAAAAAQSESNAAGSATTATTKAQEAADSAAQALIRMNSADASAQAAEDASSFFTSTILPNAVTTINNAKDQAVANVNVAKSTAVQNVQAEGATQISAVQTESTTQQAAIQQKGEDVLESIPADYTELSDDVAELQSAVGSNAFALDEHILKPIKYATLSSNMTVTFDSPASQLNTDFMTGLIPLPVTLDGKITHNGFGYSNYRAIVFYDSSKSPIGSETHNGYDFIETTIPDGASFFRLNSRASASHILQASFNLSAAEKANYLRTLMHVEPDLYIYDFDAPNILTIDRTEISTTTGEASYSSGSSYSATDFILLPDDIELIGTYAYTAAGRARVAFYDADKVFISAVYSTSKRLAATSIPENAVYVRFGTHSTIPPASCIAVGLVKATISNDEIIDMIRQALV